jgi:recombination associated protein RdgC
MKLIKNAITFKCVLPAAVALEANLSENKFAELGDVEYSRAGFIPPFGDDFVITFPGGFAFTVRYDEKIIPASVVNSEAQKRISAKETEEDHRIGRKERQVIREEVYSEFLPKALIKEQRITCFYRPDDELLIVPTTSKMIADIVTSKLIRSIGSIKAATIYVDGIKQSLTSKLHAYLQGDDHALHPFTVGGSCKLKGHKEKGEPDKTLSFKMADIQESKEGILEAIDKAAQVVELCLKNDHMEFRINADYILKGITFLGEPDETEYETEIERFKFESSTQALFFANANNQLLKLFEYKEQPEEQAEAA